MELNLATFVGPSELSRGDSGDVLLQGGVYGVVRHPRYLSVIIGIAGFSMFVNHFGAYVLVFGSFLALWFVAIIEERILPHVKLPQ